MELATNPYTKTDNCGELAWVGKIHVSIHVTTSSDLAFLTNASKTYIFTHTIVRAIYNKYIPYFFHTKSKICIDDLAPQ